MTSRTCRPPTRYRRYTDVIPTSVFVAFAALGGPAFAQDVPSGQPVELHEVLVDEVGTETWLRFRFVAPQIAREGGSITYVDAEPDMQHLCDKLALPYIDQYALSGDVIVISLSDRPTEFGQADPDATQFFDAYRPDGASCIWEPL